MPTKTGPLMAEDLLINGVPLPPVGYNEAKKIRGAVRRAISKEAKEAKEAAMAVATEQKTQTPPLPPKEEDDDNDDTEGYFEGSLTQSDMAWIFKKWGGRKKLLRQIKTDPEIEKEFLKMILRQQVKEQEIQARAKADVLKKQGEKGGGKTKLFVVKNLHADNPGESIVGRMDAMANILRPDIESRLTDDEGALRIPEKNREIDITEEDDETGGT